MPIGWGDEEQGNYTEDSTFTQTFLGSLHCLWTWAFGTISSTLFSEVSFKVISPPEAPGHPSSDSELS